MKLLLLTATTLLLTGCAGFQERCANYGFTPGTNDFANCIQRLDDNSRRAWAAMGNYRIQPLPQAQPIQPYFSPTYTPRSQQLYQPQQRMRMNCTTTNSGVMSYTNCY